MAWCCALMTRSRSSHVPTAVNGSNGAVQSASRTCGCTAACMLSMQNKTHFTAAPSWTCDDAVDVIDGAGALVDVAAEDFCENDDDVVDVDDDGLATAAVVAVNGAVCSAVVAAAAKTTQPSTNDFSLLTHTIRCTPPTSSHTYLSGVPSPGIVSIARIIASDRDFRSMLPHRNGREKKNVSDGVQKL
jgi:hypothetical protein